MIDILGLPLTCFSALWLANVKRALHRTPLTRRLLQRLRVLPVRHHYYEPIVYAEDLRHSLEDERILPGLDLNIPEQLELLEKFHYSSELASLPLESNGETSYYYHNKMFESGDSEILYNMIRHFKPAKIIEIGSGYSTLMVRYAIQGNIEADAGYTCSHVCVEPFESPWLEKTGAEVIRQKVEHLDPHFFQSLEKNDILFIDSSHVIRPQGDVLFEYLELLGTLNSGVIIHVHDVFTPRDYPERWVLGEMKLWNEQYLLEAFLSYNSEFRVLGSINHLWHNYREILGTVCPILQGEPEREPGSFWLVRN